MPVRDNFVRYATAKQEETDGQIGRDLVSERHAQSERGDTRLSPAGTTSTARVGGAARHPPGNVLGDGPAGDPPEVGGAVAAVRRRRRRTSHATIATTATAPTTYWS